MLVIGTDRFMHMAYWYPAGLAIETTDYITEDPSTAQFFA